MSSIRIPKRDVDTRNFFILQNISYDVVHSDIRTDGEFANTVAIFIGMTILPEIVFKLFVKRKRLFQAAVINQYRQRSFSKIAIFLAKIIADHSVDYERSVHALRRRKGLATR